MCLLFSRPKSLPSWPGLTSDHEGKRPPILHLFLHICLLHRFFPMMVPCAPLWNTGSTLHNSFALKGHCSKFPLLQDRAFHPFPIATHLLSVVLVWNAHALGWWEDRWGYWRGRTKGPETWERGWVSILAQMFPLHGALPEKLCHQKLDFPLLYSGPGFDFVTYCKCIKKNKTPIINVH